MGYRKSAEERNFLEAEERNQRIQEREARNSESKAAAQKAKDDQKEAADLHYKQLSTAGVFALDMFAAGEAAKANQQRDMANASIAAQARKVSANREGQAYMANQQALKDQNTSDNFNISIAEAGARDNLDLAMAGSGIGGASVDQISSEISREVGRDRVAAKKAMQVQQDAMNQQRIQSNENRIVEAENAYVHDYTEDLKGALFQSVGKAATNLA